MEIIPSIIWQIILAQFITLSTRYLAFAKNWGVVRASSSLTLLVYFIAPSLATLTLGATFVGFTLPERMGWPRLAFASLLYSLMHAFYLKSMQGIGGALGLFAFVACSFIYVIIKWRDNIYKFSRSEK
jgi:hypothetical protein